MHHVIQVILTGVFLSGFFVSAHAQLTDSEGSAQWVASKIAADRNGTAEEYFGYAERLARTMSQYNAPAQVRILGFLPPAGEGGTVAGPNGGTSSSNGGTTSPGDALANPALTSDEVFDILLGSSPLSDKDILKTLEREPALEKEHLTDLLKAQGKISSGTLVSALASGKLNLGREELKALLLSQSPLDAVVLRRIAASPNLSPEDLAEVVAAQ